MIKVTDERGNEIPGMYKNINGALIVNNNDDYRRYAREKKQAETINSLVKEVSELKTTIEVLSKTVLEIKRSINKEA